MSYFFLTYCIIFQTLGCIKAILAQILTLISLFSLTLTPHLYTTACNKICHPNGSFKNCLISLHVYRLSKIFFMKLFCSRIFKCWTCSLNQRLGTLVDRNPSTRKQARPVVRLNILSSLRIWLGQTLGLTNHMQQTTTSSDSLPSWRKTNYDQMWRYL